MFSIKAFDTLVPLLLSGLKITILVSVLGIGIGLLIGCLGGYILQSNSKIMKPFVNIYVWIIRGTPIVVLALYIYFVIPKIFHFDLSSTVAGIAVIALNSGAFNAEIIRGALSEVDKGQWEAGQSLGMHDFQVLTHLIVPPAFRAAFPALGNQFITSIKDTSLLTIIVVKDMTQQAMNYAALSFNYVETYTVLALFYLMFISCLILIQKAVEKRLLRAT